MSVLERFKALYDGLDRVHGRYDIDADLSSRQTKVQGKAVTVKAPVTLELFQRHLDGTQGLGLVPIRDDQNCVFGALDIDEYDINLADLNQKIIDMGLPLVVCRTKSGGAHAYLFLMKPIRADIVKDRLQNFAEALGYPSIEIFPKQRKIRVNDIGNWINLPYFDAQSGEFDRYAIDAESKPIMDVGAFCDYAERMRINMDELMAIKVVKAEKPFIDGPPCLQRLAESGFPDGTRNQGLFNMGVYARRKYGDDWRDKVDEINYLHMQPPLASGEVQTIMKSLERKDYFYTCDAQPICDVCSKDACLQRQYGIGSGDGGAEMESMLGGLRKSVMYNLFGEEIQDDRVLWYMDVDGVELQLTTTELFNQDRFLAKCAERLRKLPMKLKPQRWNAILKEKVESSELIEFPPETGTYGHIVGALKEFCVKAGNAETRADILAGKVWENEDGMLHFRHEAFWDYLVKKGIYRQGADGKALHVILKKLGAEKKQLMINRQENQNRWVWIVKEFGIPEHDDDAAMPIARDPKRPY